MTERKSKTTDVRSLLNEGRAILKSGGVDTADFDAACLLEHFTGLNRTDVILTPDKEIDGSDFIDACNRRAKGYPLQYLTGSWQFMGLDFTVTPDVLIPRADTETLVEYILENYSDDIKILDMCCGSGCIGLSLKHFLPTADVTLCDISDGALDITRVNADKLALDVTVKKADLTDGGAAYFKDGTFDVIVSNPPYLTTKDMDTLAKELSYEPYIALCGGEDGTDFYRALIDKWENALKVGGEMILESGYDTSDSIELLFTECGWADIKTRRDINGITRLVSAKRGKYK